MSETNAQSHAWYRSPETAQVAQPSVEPSCQPGTGTEPEPEQALFEPAAAERILARAGALQEVHGQLLSRRQIEGIAAEGGIHPEFVRLAIEQEKASVVPEQRKTGTVEISRVDRYVLSRLADFIIAYGLFLTMTTVMIHYMSRMAPLYELRDQLMLGLVFHLPALLALVLGGFGRSRRIGAVSGAALAVTVIITATLGASLVGASRWSWSAAADLPLFGAMIGAGAFLGAAGAQVKSVAYPP
ncbi:MAG: hypothetical protein H7Z41_07550 [Cytophagales bacterium]|nr:hypothetical protein [Armatimonadota bacterium]